MLEAPAGIDFWRLVRDGRLPVPRLWNDREAELVPRGRLNGDAGAAGRRHLLEVLAGLTQVGLVIPFRRIAEVLVQESAGKVKSALLPAHRSKEPRAVLDDG